MKRVAVILSGCGVYDGSEIHEAVLTLLYLDRDGAEILCFAPDKPQLHVVNHLTGQQAGENRNVLQEAARIARGKISPLSELKLDSVDAIIFPGGFGAVKNLCSYAIQGDDCEIDADVVRVIQEAVQKKKVIGAICIAPVVIAKALQPLGIKCKLTIGDEEASANSINAMGSEHINTAVNDICVDDENKIVSTPAYMLGPSISHVALGIKKLVDKVLEMK